MAQDTLLTEQAALNRIITDDTPYEVTVTPTCDTSAYAIGDVLFDRTAFTVREVDKPTYVVGFSVIDQDDQAAAQMDLYFLSADVTLGTANAAPSISDANALNLLGKVSILSTDWTDLGGCKMANKVLGDAGLPLLTVPASGTRNVYVAAVTQGTPTQTAAGIKLRLFLQAAS